MNDTPKDVLHGEAPNDVNDNKEVSFMLLQDNARKIKRNNDIAHIKERALQSAGNTFRAPITVDKAWTKRGFRSTYGPIVRATDITNGIITGSDTKRYELKQVKVVRR